MYTNTLSQVEMCIVRGVPRALLMQWNKTFVELLRAFFYYKSRRVVIYIGVYCDDFIIVLSNIVTD